MNVAMRFALVGITGAVTGLGVGFALGRSGRSSGEATGHVDGGTSKETLSYASVGSTPSAAATKLITAYDGNDNGKLEYHSGGEGVRNATDGTFELVDPSYSGSPFHAVDSSDDGVVTHTELSAYFAKVADVAANETLGVHGEAAINNLWVELA